MLVALVSSSTRRRRQVCHHSSGPLLCSAALVFVKRPPTVVPLPPGSRVVRESVTVQGSPIDMGRLYRVATKEYLAMGKDGCVLVLL